MRNFLLIILASTVLYSCKSKGKDANQPDKKVDKVEKNGYTITNDGIGDIKIGMNDADLEKLLNEKFKFRMVVDSPGYWSDTVRTKYKDIDVSLIFERQNGDSDSTYMQLIGVETTSAQSKTEFGSGIGDDRATILEPYDDRSIYMGPEWEQVNDTTWLPSKSKYSISVRNDESDRELIFHLVNKKCVSLGVTLAMGE